MVFKKWAFFGRKKVVIFRFPQVRIASPGFSGLPGIDFTIKKLIFTRKIGNTGISSETTRESRVAGCPATTWCRIFTTCRVPEHELPGAGCRVPCYHVVTDFPFNGFLRRGHRMALCKAAQSMQGRSVNHCELLHR